MSKFVNMNNKNEDLNYRYKMPVFDVQVAGKGNGLFTMFHNMDDISKALNHPPEVIFKYLAAVSGSSYNPERNVLTGTHNQDILMENILEYIKYLIMCPNCSIPETIPSLVGNKKNPNLVLTCSACNNVSKITIPNKKIEKGIDIIIKYLKTGNTWKTSKGTMVEQTDNSEMNPFDLF